MKNLRNTLLLSLSLLSTGAFASNNFVLIGPTFNWRFGSDLVESEFSMGVEVSVWNMDTGYPIGADFGIEHSFKRNAKQYYSDVQFLVPVPLLAPIGTSLGVVYDEDFGFGQQGFIWTAMGVGTGYQARFFSEGQVVHSSSSFLSIPLMLTGM